MSRIEQAKQIYEECKDMDYLDYIESYESDIEYIAGMIARMGYNKTLSLLNAE